MPLARRLWKVCKELQLPLNDPRIQDMDLYELEFYEYSIIYDDPKLREKLENTYYDPEYEAWEKEFDDQQAKSQTKSPVELPDPDTVSWSEKSKTSTPPTTETEDDGFDIGDINDWEKEE